MQSDYGFTLSDSIDENCYIEFKNKYEKILNKRKNRWIVSADKFDIKSNKLKRFIRKGIPSELREHIWMKFSGAEDRMEENSGLFEELCNKEVDQYILKIILADIARTFPENENFKESQNELNKMKSLENVLKAFASKNPDIGYCQGLNYVAALLLLVIPSEEKVFWLFDTIITRIVQAYYIPGMECVQVDCMVLEMLIRKKIPNVYHLIKDMDTSCVVMCTKWFICLFIDVLPVETALRIIDCLIYEGDKILFRVAICLLKLNYKEFVMSQSFPEFIQCLKNIVCNKKVIECHSFMKNIFKKSNPLSYNLIKKLRQTSLLKLNATLLRE